MGQLHIFWWLLQDESLDGVTGVTYYHELLDGERTSLCESLPDDKKFGSIVCFISQTLGEIEDDPPGNINYNSSTSCKPWISLRGPVNVQYVLI